MIVVAGVAGAAADSRVKLQLGERPFPVDVGDDLEPATVRYFFGLTLQEIFFYKVPLSQDFHDLNDSKNKY